MTFADTLIHEWKTRLRSPATLSVLALFMFVLVYGALNATVQRDRRDEAAAAHTASVNAQLGRFQKELGDLENNSAASEKRPWFGSAMDVVLPTALPTAPLADFATGQADLLPTMGSISLWNPDIRMFTKYEFDDPVALALGGFDLAKSVIFVLPLLLIVLAFDVLSAERDGNRLGLTLAQGGSLRQLFWQRLFIRSGCVFGLTLLLAIWALFTNAGSQSLMARLPFFLMWALLTMVYTAFWTAVIGLVASKNLKGEVNVLLLLLLWTSLTLILPSAMAASAEAIYPTPSRVAYLAETREVETETENRESRIAGQFVSDHPEMQNLKSGEIPGYMRTAYFVTSSIDSATRPLLMEFEAAASNRDEMLRFMRYFSPAVLTQRMFSEISGSDSNRHRSYMQSAREMKASFAELVAPTVVAGRRMNSIDLKGFPVFEFEALKPGQILQQNTGVLFYLFLATALILILADRGIRRISAVPL
jgi:ABC-2 type transport system permease protein